MGQTLWQHWVQKEAKKEEVEKDAIYNELGIKPGQILSFDILDYRGKDYKVKTVEECCRKINGVYFKATNYILTEEANDPALEVRVWDMKCWLFQLYDEFAFNEQFWDVVNDAMRSSFNLDEESAVFTPVGNSTTPALLSLTNNLHEKSMIKRWQFERTAKDEAGQDYLELLYVEQDDETGWFSIWRGTEVPMDRILII